MIKVLWLVLILCFFYAFPATRVLAQTWIAANVPIENDLNDIFFIDELKGWAVGNSGVILYSTDGGLNWMQQTSNTQNRLSSVYFKTATEGYVVGKQGIILRTIDGGSNWLDISVPSYRNDLNFIGFSNPNDGWILASHPDPASDSTLIISRDGGNTWADTTGPIVYQLQSASFQQPGFIWLTGLASLHAIAFSQDNGKSWVDTLGKNLTDNLLSIFFINPTSGWVSNNKGKIWQTTDAGKTWNIQNTGPGSTTRINKIAFANANSGWAATQNGVLTTDNGGTTWELKATLEAWHSVYVHDYDQVWGVGENGKIWVYRLVTEQVVADAAFKNRLFSDTWNYLRHSSPNYLPEALWLPEIKTATGCSRIEDIGLYLVARLGAFDFWDLDWAATKDSVLAVLKLLDAWQSNNNDSYQNKLFYACYSSQAEASSAVSDSVPSLGNAYLAASLLTLRGFLQQFRPIDYETLLGYCNRILQRMDFTLWYEAENRLFFKGTKNNPAGGEYWQYLSDEGRLLPFIARVLAFEFGSENFTDLDFSNCFKAYTQFPAEYDGITIDKVNSVGSLAAYFKPGLFIQEHLLTFNNIRKQALETQASFALNKKYPVTGISDYLTYDIFEDCIGILKKAGSPPYGDPDRRGDSSQVVPHASALALLLMSEDTTHIWNNLYAIQFLFPHMYLENYGFREYVDLANESISELVNTHSQLLIFLSLLNLKNSFVWNNFYFNPSVQKVHELYGPAVPVELVLFQAQAGSGGIQLIWRTASESNNYGFEILRSMDGRNFLTIGFLPGRGTTDRPGDYRFTDPTEFSGTAFYQLKQIDMDGKINFSDVIKITLGGPGHFELRPAYPNPFNPDTRIQFSLPERERVRLEIFNDSGQKVKTLINRVLEAGVHDVIWFGENDQGQSLPSGVYFYRIEAGKKLASRRVVLIR